jgi:phosphoribosylformylglycinamidine synthase subunit PurQ / glutaminase
VRKVLVLMGDGINSENELSLAFSREGAKVSKLHVNSLLSSPEILSSYNLLALPGGFSFGDEIRSGKILAEKMHDKLINTLEKFMNNDGRMIGICNGFQVLSQLGAFDDFKSRSFTLAENSHGQFMDKWTRLDITKNDSPWLNNLEGEIFLPVRHKEGRIIAQKKINQVLRYQTDINGSFEQTAGITDNTGRIFGLMPHPEVATMSFLHPFKKGAEANAQKIRQLFINGLK